MIQMILLEQQLRKQIYTITEQVMSKTAHKEALFMIPMILQELQLKKRIYIIIDQEIFKKVLKKELFMIRMILPGQQLKKLIFTITELVMFNKVVELLLNHLVLLETQMILLKLQLKKHSTMKTLIEI